jgi:hypothetical protein
LTSSETAANNKYAQWRKGQLQLLRNARKSQCSRCTGRKHEYANNAVNEIRTAEYHVRNTYATHKKPMAVWLLLGWPTHGVKGVISCKKLKWKGCGILIVSTHLHRMTPSSGKRYAGKNRKTVSKLLSTNLPSTHWCTTMVHQRGRVPAA